MGVIYVDMLLALNLYADFVLLSATARVLGIPAVRKRLILAAAVGALSSLAVLLPPIPAWLICFYKLAIAVVMIPLAFPLRRIGTFAKATFVLFVISSLFAGICQGFQLTFHPSGFSFKNGILYVYVPPLWLLTLTTVSYALLCLYDRFTKRRLAKNEIFQLELFHGDCHVSLRAFYDSGHSLRDPFSGTPVIVANRRALGEMTPSIDGAHPPRYIPFSSIGGDGLLVSFQPQRAVLHVGGGSADISGVRVAVCDRLNKSEYDALIGPSLAVDRLSL